MDSFRGGRGGQQEDDEIKTCKYCKGKIKWLPAPDGSLRDDGTPKNLPFNAYPPFDRHRCQQFSQQQQQQGQGQSSQYRNMPNRQKSEGISCKFCGKPIKFSADQKSVSGKFIPLEMGGEPHQCPNKPQYQGRPQQTQSSRRYPAVDEELGEDQF